MATYTPRMPSTAPLHSRQCSSSAGHDERCLAARTAQVLRPPRDHCGHRRRGRRGLLRQPARAVRMREIDAAPADRRAGTGRPPATVLVYGEPPIAARRRKQIAVVPQHPGLLPWSTVRANARLLLDINAKANGPATIPIRSNCLRRGRASSRSSTPVRTSCPAACSSAWRSCAPWRWVLRCWRWTSRSRRSTRSPDPRCATSSHQLIEGRALTTVVFVTHSISEAVGSRDRVLVSSPRPARDRRRRRDRPLPAATGRRRGRPPSSSNCAPKCVTRCCDAMHVNEQRPPRPSRRSSACWCSSAHGNCSFASSTSARSCWRGRAASCGTSAEFPDDYFSAGLITMTARNVRLRVAILVALVVGAASPPRRSSSEPRNRCSTLIIVTPFAAYIGSVMIGLGLFSATGRLHHRPSCRFPPFAFGCGRRDAQRRPSEPRAARVRRRLAVGGALAPAPPVRASLALHHRAVQHRALALIAAYLAESGTGAGSGEIGSRAIAGNQADRLWASVLCDGARSAPSGWCCSRVASGSSLRWHVSQRTLRQLNGYRAVDGRCPIDLGAARRIDQLDRGLIAIVAARLAVCEEVAAVKEHSDTPVIQPARVRDVVMTRRQQAIEAGIDPDFAEQLFRVLLAETHRIEVAGHRPDAGPREGGRDRTRFGPGSTPSRLASTTSSSPSTISTGGDGVVHDAVRVPPGPARRTRGTGHRTRSPRAA